MIRLRTLLPPLLAAVLAALAPAVARAGDREDAGGAAAAPVAERYDPVLADGAWRVAPPRELHEVAAVIDGDTIHVLRDGELEKLRLLSVDTEEKLTGRPSLSPTKPETVYGEETALWAKRFFADLGRGGRPARVGLVFPGGAERRDVFGRLLCHVVLPDGRDFNLLLVETGRSPYYRKYGWSELAHVAFARAEEHAREARRGIWDPETNRSATPGAPAARRPYELLLPWWDARAEALERFRRRAAEEPDRHVLADDPEALARAADRCAEGPERTVRACGEIARFFDEDDGSLTVLLRSGARDAALRAVVPEDARAKLEPWLRASTEELRQNLVVVEGRILPGPRGYRVEAGSRSQWELAGPEPDLPSAAEDGG